MAPKKSKVVNGAQPAKPKSAALSIESDLEIPDELMSWERELLLPTVTSMVVDMIETHEVDGGESQ